MDGLFKVIEGLSKIDDIQRCEIERLTKQRDRLMEALEKVENYSKSALPHLQVTWHAEGVIKLARAALAEIGKEMEGE